MNVGLQLALAALTAGPADGDAEWEPADAPPPTAWARAGARPWRSCDSAARQAVAVRLSTRGRGKFERVWRARAKHCPGAPDVLVLAAQEEILEAIPPGWMPDLGEEFDTAIERQRVGIEEAVRLLDAAIGEAARRGELPPLEAHYFRAYASSVLGDVAQVRLDLGIAAELGDAERWRIERMAAVAAVFAGELDEALRLAHLALVDAPPDAGERQISRYVWALVLDRAGSPSAARSVFRRLRREPDHATARRAVESILPAHERVFLRAIEHQAHGENTNAIRLWEAYLARPEPTEADRALAQRHRDELRR